MDLNRTVTILMFLIPRLDQTTPGTHILFSGQLIFTKFLHDLFVTYRMIENVSGIFFLKKKKIIISKY